MLSLSFHHKMSFENIGTKLIGAIMSIIVPHPSRQHTLTHILTLSLSISCTHTFELGKRSVSSGVGWCLPWGCDI